MFKQRDRGLSAGELLVAMASCQLAGGDHLVSLDRLTADQAGQRLQELTGLDRGNGRGRVTITTLRRTLTCIPGRIIRHARRLEIRLPPGPQLLPAVLDRLTRLPDPG